MNQDQPFLAAPAKPQRRSTRALGAIALGSAVAITCWVQLEPTSPGSVLTDIAPYPVGSEQHGRPAEHFGIPSREGAPALTQDAMAPPRGEPLPTTMPAVGSEGYAPYIQAAVDDGSSAQALQAVRQLDHCKRVSSDMEIGRKVATQTPGLAPEKAKSMLDYVSYLESVQRRCQTVTPQIEALRMPLLLKALQGGETGAASEYVRAATHAELAQPGRQELVLSALRADALRGDVPAMQALANPLALPYAVPPSLQRPAEYASLQIQQRWLKSKEGAAFGADVQQRLGQHLGGVVLNGWNIGPALAEHVAERLAKLQSPQGGMEAQEQALAAEMLAAFERQLAANRGPK